MFRHEVPVIATTRERLASLNRGLALWLLCGYDKSAVDLKS